MGINMDCDSNNNILHNLDKKFLTLWSIIHASA
jgi:hypothetical protein